MFDGGIRVPFVIRWPGHTEAGRKIDTLAAHIDVMPTLLEACNVPMIGNPEMDGKSLVPLIYETATNWPERTLFFQWHRGDAPTEYRNFAAVQQRFKLIQNSNHWKPDLPLAFQLFDLEHDPAETSDLSNVQTEKTAALKQAYDQWFSGVCKTRGFPPSPAWVGTDHENPVVLTQQDRRGAEGWGNGTYYPDAFWPVQIIKKGSYTLTMQLYAPADHNGTAFIKLGDRLLKAPIEKGATECTFNTVRLNKNELNIKAWAELGDHTESPRFLNIELTQKP